MAVSKIPRAFAEAAPAKPTAPLKLAVQKAAPKAAPKVVLPPRRGETAREETNQQPQPQTQPQPRPQTQLQPQPQPQAQTQMLSTATAPALQMAAPKVTPSPTQKGKKEPQPSSRVRIQQLERGMIVAYQETIGTCDASVGTVDSVFSAINEVWIIPDDDETTVRCSINQVTFLGTWSKTLEIINSIDVPADLEAILGQEQMEQIQDLAQEVPCHLETLSADAAPGSMAQLVFGPAPAKSVKLALEAVVSHVDGLDFPDANVSSDPALAAMPWAVPSMGVSNVPMMMVPMWPSTAWAPQMGGWPTVAPAYGMDATLEAPVLGDPGEWTDPSGHDGADWTESGSAVGAAGAAEDPTPPWRSQELPPPPKRPSSVSTVRVKRFRRAAPKVKEELEEAATNGTSNASSSRATVTTAQPAESNLPGVKTEKELNLLHWAKQQHVFKDMPSLPPGWIRVKSKNGDGIYYVYLPTGEATFDSPLDRLPPGWEVVTSKSTGKQYYWNAEQQISQFERPT